MVGGGPRLDARDRGWGRGGQTVEIEYWQYIFAQRVQAIDELIKRFEAANPGITVKHTHVPV